MLMPEANKKAEHYVGVDLGGTKIYAGVFRPSLELLGTARLSTKAERAPGEVINRIARAVTDAIDECDLSIDRIKAVGVGAPGAVDAQTGSVIFAPNLKWKNIPLKKELEERLGVPVFIENDANIQMIGIYECELESKPRHVVGIFIGTGIGGAIIINREMYSGINHAAGEIGHMVIKVGGPKCGCGNNGCFEALASRTAIFREIQAAVKGGEKTLLTAMLGKDLEDLRSRHIRKALRQGDELVQRVMDRAAEYTGIAVANLMNLLNPEVVVLGGGLIEALGELVVPDIVKTARAHALRGTAEGIQIQASVLGDRAGILGGAVIARRGTK